MGKKSRKDDESKGEKSNGSSHTKKAILDENKAVDPALALLFASSAGPVRAPPKARYEQPPPSQRLAVEDISGEESDENAESEDDANELSSIDENLEDADMEDLLEASEGLDSSDGPDISDGEPNLDKLIEASVIEPDRKRKRKSDEEDLEGKYMHKLAKEEEKEEQERQAERRLKRQRLMAEQDRDMSEESEDLNEGAEEESGDDSDEEPGKISRTVPSNVPLHESLAPSKDDAELEKASRTVFLANVSTDAISSKTAKKTLLTHMASFFNEIPAPVEGKPSHRVESIRFRSTAYAGGGLPKKGAFAKKELMPATTKSTNAYVVYSSAFAAREAVKRLNGTMILERHLRVDGVAHPAKTDHRRCVFVGNLGFVDDESMLDQGGENERKRSKIPSDVEEGLWRQFSKAGTVESVRVVRDEKTRVGKGFAYVQFHDANAVEAALLFNEKKYPPMLPRILRVVRAKAVKKTALASQSRPDPRNAGNASKTRIYNPKVSSELSSLQGRAGKLLGRAGAAQFKKKGSGANETALGKRGQGQRSNSGGSKIEGIAKTPEAVVFEGYRASAKSGKPKDLKMGGKGKKSAKPKTRGSKRASEWRKAGGKKK